MKSRVLIAVLLVGGCSDESALSGPLAVTSPAAVTAPLANAGPDAEVLRGFPTVLRGAGSYHPGGASFNARWEQVEGARVPLSNPESLQPTFIAALEEQELVFELTVDDGAFSTVDQVTLKVVRKPTRVAPTVRAGPDRIVASSQDATPSGDEAAAAGLTPVWESVVISPSPFARVRREYDGPRVFRVTASRDGLSSAPDYLLLRRPDAEESNNAAVSRQAPTGSLIASSDLVEPGETFELDASGTTDANGDAFTVRWEQLRGEPVFSTDDAGALVRSLTAPVRPQELVFRVYASDGRLESAPAEVRIVVRPRDRDDGIQVGAGLDLRSRPGRPVVLNAAQVVDAKTDGTLAYEWVQTFGSDVDLEVDEGGNARFSASEPDVFAFALTASDEDLISAPAVSTVTVVGPEENAGPSVFICSSAQSPEPGQVVVLATRIFDPEGDALLAPEWRGPEGLNIGDMSTPSAGQTCAGDAPTSHGGPEGSAAVTSIAFEMPDSLDPVTIELESCDELEKCTVHEVEFIRAE